MNKLNELKEKKLDNKGFSLVELIIVIAIMAVLIGVLAPQYLKYVDKSRKSADLDNIDAIISAIEIYSSDPDHTIVQGAITIAAKAGDPIIGSPSGSIKTALDDAGISYSTMKLKSAAYAGSSINFGSDGKMTVTNGSGGGKLKEDLGR